MCSICQSETEPAFLSKVTLGNDTEYDLVECRKCKLRYLSPMPTVEELEKFYSPQYYGGDWYKQRGLGMAFAKSVLSKRPAGKFLDVGCGLGFYIDGIRKNSKWEVYGVEFAENVVEFAKKELGLNVRQGELTKANFPSDYFDYIQIRNVLEHVSEPVELLKECRRIIKYDGILNLAVPNGLVDSLDLINFYKSERQAALSNMGHLYFFSKEALLHSFEKAGFSVEKSRTYGIRRGLARMGYFTRRKNWKKDYKVKPIETVNNHNRIALSPKKNRPDLYYKYRYFRMHSKMLPGMQNFGLDFELLLKPIK